VTGTLQRSGNDRERPHRVVIFVLDDVAMVDVRLRCHHARRQIEFRANPGEVAGVGFDRVLKTALRRVGRFFWSRRKWTRIDPAGNAVRPAVGFFVGLSIERCSPLRLGR
jgi:hypothetical protein